ncbi:MAG: PD-(D/E)XK nuclease family protein, partial [Planctomycetes bacterium]|nr:PD-(D/E)XK nuclease family protein [Planctomycetota bacterium]
LSGRLREAPARLAVAAHVQQSADAPDWAAGIGLGQWAESLVAAATAAPVSRPLFEPVKGPLRLSYTHVQQYLDCPRCYYARYVLRVPESPSAALQLGTVVHVALERFYRRWMDADASGAPTPGLDEMLDIGRRTLIDTAPSDATIEKSMRAQVEAQLRLTFHTLHSAHDHVLAVESRVVFPFVSDGVTHRVEAKLDRIDRTDAGFRIIDYKTGAATKTRLTPARADLQLGIYALALPYHFEPDAPEPPPVPAGSAEYWLLSTGQRGSIGLSDLDLGKVRSRIETTIAGITAGRFDKGKSCRHLCDLIAEPATQ